MSALAGLRVLDLSRLLPGGFCSLLLADFGADVVKVEDTGMGDYVRWSPPYYEGAAHRARRSRASAIVAGRRPTSSAMRRAFATRSPLERAISPSGR